MFKIKQYQREALATMVAELITDNVCDNMGLMGYTFPVGDGSYLNEDDKSLLGTAIYYIFKQGEHSDDSFSHTLDVWGDDSFKPAYIKHLRAIFGDDHILENQNKWADLLHTVLNDLGDESCGYLTEWFQEDVEMPECVKMGIDLYNEEMYPFEDVVGWFFNMTQPSINMNGADMFYTFFVITLFIIVITGLILDRQIKALRNSMHDKYGTKPTDDETIGKLP